MENKPKTNKQRLTNYFSLSLNSGWVGGGHIIPIDDDKEYKFHTYMVTKLAYNMLCEPIYLDKEYK